MVKIQVLASGCPTCQSLDRFMREILADDWQDLEVEYEYVTGNEGLEKIMKLGIMHSPVLTVNDQVVMVGSFNSKDKVRDKIWPAVKEALEAEK